MFCKNYFSIFIFFFFVRKVPEIAVILQWLALPFTVKLGLHFTYCLIVLNFSSEKLLCRKSVNKCRWSKEIKQGTLSISGYQYSYDSQIFLKILSKSSVSFSCWYIERLFCINQMNQDIYLFPKHLRLSFLKIHLTFWRSLNTSLSLKMTSIFLKNES